jgi:hypothetical protein
MDKLKTPRAFIYSMIKTTYNHPYHHHYHSIMYHQRFIFNSNMNSMILSQLEKHLMEDYSLYIYTLIHNFLLTNSN